MARDGRVDVHTHPHMVHINTHPDRKTGIIGPRLHMPASCVIACSPRDPGTERRAKEVKDVFR